MIAQSDFELTPKQIEVRKLFGGPQTHSLVYGGSRSGKTFLITRTILARAAYASHSYHLMGRLNHMDAKRHLMMKTFREVLRIDPAFRSLNPKIFKNDQIALLPNGSEIWFSGLDDDERVEKILGAEFCSIALNECSQISFDTVETVRSRLAQSITNEDGEEMRLRAFYDLNPTTADHWTYKEFVELVNPIDGTPHEDPEDYAYVQMNPDENPHLSQAYLKQLSRMSMLKRKRFKDGVFLTALPDSLWTPAMISAARSKETAPLTALRRVVVAVDPGGTMKGDKTGIVVVGLDYQDQFHVLADVSLNGTPAEWAYMVLWAYTAFDADCVVVETNFGSDMCQHTIRTAAPPSMKFAIRVKEVRGKRGFGKSSRAELIVGLFQNDQVSFSDELYAHWPEEADAPTLPPKHTQSTELFDQLMAFVPEVAGKRRRRKSPDNADALVYALIELSGAKPRGVDSRPRMFVGLAGNRKMLG